MQIHCLYDELVDPKSLKPHPSNRNAHPDAQIARLAQILSYQGIRYAIKVSRQSGFITSGHGRRLALIKAGVDSVPVVYQDYVDAAQEYGDIVADNAISAWAELDLAAINMDLADLKIDVDLLGIGDFALGTFKADLDEKEKKIDESKYFLEIELTNEKEKIDLYEELLSRGLIVRSL
jgi:hypothetical protein